MPAPKDLNQEILELEKEVAAATEAWTNAQLNRDPIAIKDTEEKLVLLTTELNTLKMRRPV